MCNLLGNHNIKVINYWDNYRTDWLLGTTIRASETSSEYSIDGILVQKLTHTKKEKLKMLPWVLLFYATMDESIKNLSKIIEPNLDNIISKDTDIIHNFRIGREPLSYASYNISKKRGIPFALTPFHHPRWGGWLHKQYQNLYKKADLLCTMTDYEKKYLVSLGINQDKIWTIGNGPVIATNSNGKEFREKYDIRDEPMILFLGQKFSYKGIASLINASNLVWNELSDVIFVFIGPRTPYSKKLFKDIKDKRIIEIDTVDLQTKSNALDACDVLCVPSSQESFGGVYTEAWLYKKPVIGCRIPAVSEVIDDNENGFLVSQDPEDIAKRILDLLKNPKMAKTMGESGFIKVIDNFTWEKISKKLESAYLSVK
jgi:glycosyltransferase involved in cell wall biosynthesis